jgi:glycyl-tRNA synthetase
MIKIYNDNGLPFFDENWLLDRWFAERRIAKTMEDVLWDANKAWTVKQIEAPSLIPGHLISKEYDSEDIYVARDSLALKPETTASSYAYAQYMNEHQEFTPPFCVWQASKSFRRENDQVSKNVRLKEFYQQEFQCIVTADTKKDYQDHETLEVIRQALMKLTGLDARVVPSDRLPSYSDLTLDIELKTPHKWLEVCSISKRHDVPFEWEQPHAKGKPRFSHSLINYEFAFGLDRVVYCMQLGKTDG